MPGSRSKKILTGLLILIILVTVGGFWAYQQKYYVKKLIRGNDFLYEQAMKVARLKKKMVGGKGEEV